MILTLALAEPTRAADPKPIAVPYRLTATNHVLVRAKINGKGPYHFIVDTGAPALFVAAKVATAAGVKADESGWAVFERFEIEGGVVFEKASGKAEDVPQLGGINGLGLAGVELHGVIGFNLLARHRIEFDFTRDTLQWTPLAYDPPELTRRRGKPVPSGLEVFGRLMRVAGSLMGIQPAAPAVPRGFLGVELAADGNHVVIRRVLTGSPAESAGLRPGDRIVQLNGMDVATVDRVVAASRSILDGTTITIVVTRDGREVSCSATITKGL